MQYCKLSSQAIAPTLGSDLAAGYDLYSAYSYTIPKWGRKVCWTDLQLRVPKGSYGRLASRSGLAFKYCIDVGAGVVDEDYTGNVGILIINNGPTEYSVTRGDRIAQLICERIMRPPLREFKRTNDTGRGSRGFGSSGR